MWSLSAETRKTTENQYPCYESRKTEIYKCDDCGKKGLDGEFSYERIGPKDVNFPKIDIKFGELESNNSFNANHSVTWHHKTTTECTSPRKMPKNDDNENASNDSGCQLI